ncbi:hypothetical protein CHS0354_012366 [Potamilus streckersoni]|uniref:NXPE C-terminal domain-containing protein n=1 Tax=Potamilus streckersoni TaxID=2493646 RepID=A0AAE0SJN8_9BIVA|nr:hypothetical protein CHS0354_012366 [Potamilus streckersoni]
MSDGYTSRLWIFHVFVILAVLFNTAYVGYQFGPQIVSIGRERFPSRDEEPSARIAKLDFLPINFTVPDDALTDPKATAFANNSRMYLVDTRRLFEVGQIIEVNVELFDGYSKRRTIGGDDVRVRLYNDDLKAYANGYVIDNGNGSYIARLIALWKGKSRIEVTLYHTREAIKAMYRMREQFVGNHMGKFKAGDVEEDIRCHPLARMLKGRELCNLTLENGGLSWYCWKPSNIKLLCHDWVEVIFRPPSHGLPLTNAEKGLLSPGGYGISIPGNIKVEVRNFSNIYMNLPECANVNSFITWNQQSPTGYFYNSVWKPLHCRGFSNLTKIQQCLKGKELVLFGDSTTRHWFETLESLLECKLVSGSWSTAKWHKPAKAFCIHDFFIHWLPHAMPFSVGPRWDTRRYLRPISAYLEEIRPNEKVIIVVHLFMHLEEYHPDVFRDRIQRIARSVRHLLQRNPHVKIFMKGAHTFLARRPDYFNSVFDSISHQAFKGLHDKVVFLKIRCKKII